MRISTADIKNALGINTIRAYAIMYSTTRAGVKIDTKTLRTPKGFFNVAYYDIDEAIQATQECIKTHPQRGRYIKHWENRVEKLENIKRLIIRNRGRDERS